MSAIFIAPRWFLQPLPPYEKETHIDLSSDVLPQMVADVLAILIGAGVARSIPDPVRATVVGNPRFRKWLWQGAQPPGLPMVLEIDVGDRAKDILEYTWPEEAVRFEPIYWRWLTEGNAVVELRTTAYQVAIAERVIAWFGGVVSAVDSDSDLPPVATLAQSPRGCPTDADGKLTEGGAAWKDYKESLLGLPPLSSQHVQRWIDKGLTPPSSLSRDRGSGS